jgi:hypothetical protein
MAIPEKPLTRQEMYLDAIAKKGGGGGSALPAVTSADNGKMLTVVDGAWAADDNRFVVTLTPTAADYSGTMDKTVGEIREAWQDGKSIYFYLDGAGYCPLGIVESNFMAYAININQNVIIVLCTDGVSNYNTYYTKIYQLTPMGS